MIQTGRDGRERAGRKIDGSRRVEGPPEADVQRARQDGHKGRGPMSVWLPPVPGFQLQPHREGTLQGRIAMQNGRAAHRAPGGPRDLIGPVHER